MENAEIVKITFAGRTRYVQASHLVSWAAHSGPGETLVLDTKRKLPPVLHHLKPPSTGNMEILTREEHAERHKPVPG